MATEATQELAFQQVKTRRVFEEICDQIRQRLASGALRPGDKLSAERDLALEFKVSRPAVRDPGAALRLGWKALVTPSVGVALPPPRPAGRVPVYSRWPSPRRSCRKTLSKA